MNGFTFLRDWLDAVPHQFETEFQPIAAFQATRRQRTDGSKANRLFNSFRPGEIGSDPRDLSGALFIQVIVSIILVFV